MKKMLKVTAEGFTLVELMVVVAIIGILSAIAVPNFKKYQAKSKQSEAKIQLAAVYNTEVGASADYDTYSTCISDLGYETNPKGYYIIGFSATDTGTSVATITSRGGTCTTSNFAMLPTNLKKVAGSAPAATNLTGTSVSNTAFTAAAAGNIATTLMDTWSINEGKSIVNTNVGY